MKLPHDSLFQYLYRVSSLYSAAVMNDGSRATCPAPSSVARAG